MGLLTNKDDEYNASLELEKMMKQFDISLEKETSNEDKDTDTERINRRRKKIKKERE